MDRILDWFTIGEVPETVLLILILNILGEQVTQPTSVIRKYARRCSAGIFLAYVLLGIGEWSPADIGAVLVIVLRAALAAGVGYGVSILGMALSLAIIGDPVASVRTWIWSSRAKNKQRAEDASRRRERELQEERDRADNVKRGAIMADEQRRQAEEEARQTRERHSKTDEVRAEVIRFYEMNTDILCDALPAALFRARLQTQFPEAIQPDQAWKAAQEMIGEMVPMIATAKSERRQTDKSNQDRTTAIERMRRSIRRLEQEQQQIMNSTSFDPEISEPELRSIRESVRDLQEQLEALELSHSEISK